MRAGIEFSEISGPKPLYLAQNGVSEAKRVFGLGKTGLISAKSEDAAEMRAILVRAPAACLRGGQDFSEVFLRPAGQGESSGLTGQAEPAARMALNAGR